MHSELRSATVDDIEGVLAFWQEAAEPTSTDSTEVLTSLVGHHPGALIVAEVDGRIVGTVIAGWDGWRGSIYRLAVGPDQRRSGIGQALLRAAEDRLTALGARRWTKRLVRDWSSWRKRTGSFSRSSETFRGSRTWRLPSRKLR